MRTWTFTAHAVPKGQPRVRATALAKGKVRMWTPTVADNFKGAVALAAAQAIGAGDRPIETGWTLEAVFFMPRPQRLNGRKGGARERIPHLARPDIDNLLKAAVDAIVDIGIVRDDAPLWLVQASKFYAEPEGIPRAEFTLTTNTDDTVHG